MKETVKNHMEKLNDLNHPDVKNAASNALLVIQLKETARNREPRVEAELLQQIQQFGQLLDRRNNQNQISDRQKQIEAVKLVEVGMHRVFVENIKRWLLNPHKWAAFNQSGKMSSDVNEWFSQVASMCKVSRLFCTAITRAGIHTPLIDFLNNDQVQDAFERNDKTQAIVAFSISTLNSIGGQRMARRLLDNPQVSKVLVYYATTSKSVNVTGLSYLALSRLAALCPHKTKSELGPNPGLGDCEMLLATYAAYKQLGGVLGDFLAKYTDLPYLFTKAMLELSEKSEDSLNEKDFRARIRPVIASISLFSDKSLQFSEAVVDHGISAAVDRLLSSNNYKKNIKEDRYGDVLNVCTNLVAYCLRSRKSWSKFNRDNLWKSLYEIANNESLGKEHVLRATSMLGFVQAYNAMRQCDGSFESLHISKFPSLSASSNDMALLLRLWNCTNDDEEKMLGDYLAFLELGTIYAKKCIELVPTSKPIIEILNDNNSVVETRQMLAIINNIVLESENFAVQLCGGGLLDGLCYILKAPQSKKGLANSLLEPSVCILHGCALYEKCMPFYSKSKVMEAILPYVVPEALQIKDLSDDLKRRAGTAALLINYYDPIQVQPFLESIRIRKSTFDQLQYLKNMYASTKVAQKDQRKMLMKYLNDCGLAKAMAEQLQQMHTNDTLVEEFALTDLLLTNMLNMTDSDERFSNELRDNDALLAVQEIVRDPRVRQQSTTDGKYTAIVGTGLSILANCAQYQSNRNALVGMRMIDDLLRYVQLDGHLDTLRVPAMMTISFLVNEDNAHVLRTTSRDRLLRYMLEQLEQCALNDVSNGYKPSELLCGLRRLALNETNAAALVYEDTLPLLATLIEHFSTKSLNQTESLEHSLYLLWTLLFIDDNKKAVRDDSMLIAQLEELAKQEYADMNIRQIAQGVLFEVDINGSRSLPVLNRQLSVKDSYSTPKTYISFDSRDVAVAQCVSYYLRGRSVDVVTTHEILQNGLNPYSSLSRIVKSVPVIIVIMSRHYIQSSHSRTEAQLAAAWRKKIIPVKGRRLKIGGWLARLTVGLHTVDLSKRVPDHCRQKALEEIYESVVSEVKT